MTRILVLLLILAGMAALVVAFAAGAILMPLVALTGLLVGTLVGALIGSAATARDLTGEMINADLQALAAYEAADRLQAEAERAGLFVNRLREIIADQARIVRAAVGQPTKRPVPAGSTR